MPSEWREGDWSCNVCGDEHVYGSKRFCRCGAPKGAPGVRGGARGGGARGGGGGRGGGRGGSAFKPGDWICPACNDHAYASRTACRCGEPKPVALPPAVGRPGPAYTAGGGSLPAGFRLGDWLCPSCGDVVFGSRRACRCGTPKPAAESAAAAALADAALAGAAGDDEAPLAGAGALAMPPVAAAIAVSGSWTCPACAEVNDASRFACRCGAAPTVPAALAAPRAGARPSSVR